MNQRIRELIKNALMESIWESGHNAFILSQHRVPVRTGALKRSGSFKDEESGMTLRYGKDYASFLERGVRAQIVKVQGFYRRDGSYVRSHFRNMSERIPVRYIASSMEESFGGFRDRFHSNLFRKFGSSARIF